MVRLAAAQKNWQDQDRCPKNIDKIKTAAQKYKLKTWLKKSLKVAQLRETEVESFWKACLDCSSSSNEHNHDPACNYTYELICYSLQLLF